MSSAVPETSPKISPTLRADRHAFFSLIFHQSPVRVKPSKPFGFEQSRGSWPEGALGARTANVSAVPRLLRKITHSTSSPGGSRSFRSYFGAPAAGGSTGRRSRPRTRRRRIGNSRDGLPATRAANPSAVLSNSAKRMRSAQVRGLAFKRPRRKTAIAKIAS